jgi:hypothetical protein
MKTWSLNLETNSKFRFQTNFKNSKKKRNPFKNLRKILKMKKKSLKQEKFQANQIIK